MPYNESTPALLEQILETLNEILSEMKRLNESLDNVTSADGNIKVWNERD